jgi:hypothetical protein
MLSEYVKRPGKQYPGQVMDMLYLLELFDSGTIDNNHRPIELNLICPFNEYDNV